MRLNTSDEGVKSASQSATTVPSVSAASASTAMPADRRPVSIKQEDLIQSIADGLQYISYYHPVDYIRNLAVAYEREESPAAKDAIAQILINSRMCAEGHRPICQDTGIVTVFLEVGMDVRWDDATMACGGHGPRGRAPRLQAPGQQAARQRTGRSSRQTHQYEATTRPAWST